MPKEQKIPRQRPVSCLFCRSRKLRCSREAPCSNCISRGISCELETTKQSSNRSAEVLDSNSIERIRELENLVQSLKSQRNKHAEQDPQDFDTQAEQSLNPTSSYPSEHVEKDIAWLENIYHSQDLTDNLSSNRIVFKTCPIKSAMAMPSHISQSDYLGSRCIWLPHHDEAKILLKKFVEDIDHVHHVVHTPSLHSILNGVYSGIQRREQIKSGFAILILAIFASATSAWQQCDNERGIFSTPEEARIHSRFWIKEAEDLLDVAHRTTSVSLEGVQGLIIAVFVVMDLEGFSRRGKSLWNTAMLLGRELELHLIDHPTKSHLARSAQAEMGRRVWWYLIASDWMMASKFLLGGYQCHLRQMMVNKPLNINDEDVVDGMNGMGRPSSLPTSMSYSLHRIKLAEIARNLVDRLPLIKGHSGGPDHDLILDIDTQLQLLLNEIPAFFSMTQEKLMEVHHVNPSRASDIVQQGHMVYSFIYAQRCELHFPFYSRGFVDPTYAPSRDACVQSARLLIQVQPICTPYKFLGLLVGVFIASIILVVDICHGKSSSQREAKREEIAKACQILEGARHESTTAAKFLDSLMHVLRKHKVSPPRNEDIQPTVDPAMSHTATDAMATGNDGFGNSEDLSSYFNDMAQSFEQGGSFDWDNMLSDLSSAFV